jgi:hypothetical protein
MAYHQRFIRECLAGKLSSERLSMTYDECERLSEERSGAGRAGTHDSVHGPRSRQNSPTASLKSRRTITNAALTDATALAARGPFGPRR